MLKRILGKKIGMTQVFTKEGERIPVTVVEAGPLHVLKVFEKNDKNSHLVNAIEVGFDTLRELKPELKEKFKDNFKLTKALRLNKPTLGQYKKAGFEKKFGMVKQLRVEDPKQFEIGSLLTLDNFEFVKKVTVKGLTKGRGFTGPIKRYGLQRGPQKHGSRYHRRPGSLGPSAWPSRVFPGKKMAGQHGNTWVTVKNLEVVKVDVERNLLIIKGAIPGANGNYLFIKASS